MASLREKIKKRMEQIDRAGEDTPRKSTGDSNRDGEAYFKEPPKKEPSNESWKTKPVWELSDEEWKKRREYNRQKLNK